MSDTAPFVSPIEIFDQQIQIQDLDLEKINTFNSRVEICSQCEKYVEHDNIPYCLEQNISLSAAADKEQCPIGKW